ncbi:invs [Symbiodinium sp. KB8]|nr:invs [Symbiodinium sp. KB8]
MQLRTNQHGKPYIGHLRVTLEAYGVQKRRSRQNLLRAWRLDLDVKQTGTVSFPDFANACRRLGLQGQCRMIWTSLRPLDDKALEFADLAPNEAAHVEAFAEMIWEASGYDLDKAWRLFDYDQKNKLTKADFVQSARHLGFQGSADLLFKGLDATGLGWVWRDDFDYIPKVSQVARQRLHGAEGPLAGLVRFAQREMGGAEELISKLGLGGAQSEVTVCDLAARLTALGYDGDAQRVAVHAAKCDSGSGTNVSSEKLYRILSAQKKEKPRASDRADEPAAISPNVYMRKRSTGTGVSAKLLTKKKPKTPVSQHPPWNSSMQDLIGDSNKLHPNLRKYFSDFDPENIRKKQAASQAMKEAAKTSSKFSPPARASTTSRSTAARQAKPNWITSLPAESENTPRACRRYFQSGEHKPVRDEVHDLLRMRANHTPGLQDGGLLLLDGLVPGRTRAQCPVRFYSGASSAVCSWLRVSALVGHWQLAELFHLTFDIAVQETSHPIGISRLTHPLLVQAVPEICVLAFHAFLPSQAAFKEAAASEPGWDGFGRGASSNEYPTTPLFLTMSADKPKAPGTQPRIGIDIGGVLTRQGDRTYMGPLDEWDTTWEADGALDAVGKIAQVFGPSNTFLVSKVSPGKSMHRRMEQWLHETMDFCEVTGVPKDNIVFVSAVSGTQGKGVVCERLGISHFVDDKIEVLKSVFEDELKHESLKSLPHRQQTLFRDAGMEADTDDPGTQLQLPIQKAGQEDHNQSSSASALEILLEEAACQTRADEAALVGLVLQDEPESFQVVLRPITGCKLGLAVMEFGRKLLVAAVHPKGVVSTWNATYPDLSIEERDLLVQVNHATEYFGMVQQLRFSQVLLLKLQRQESIKSLPIPVRAKWEPRVGTGESSSDLDSNLALRAVTESLGPHSPSTWKSAAKCVVEHFVHQEHLFLGFYGYRILTNRTWADCPVAGQTPILSLTVKQHIEQAGHTWYIVSCELVLFNAGERDVLKWEAPRRLAQLRTDLHDRVKFGMEPKEYKALFEEAPFAHAGGHLPGSSIGSERHNVAFVELDVRIGGMYQQAQRCRRILCVLATAATWSSGLSLRASAKMFDLVDSGYAFRFSCEKLGADSAAQHKELKNLKSFRAFFHRMQLKDEAYLPELSMQDILGANWSSRVSLECSICPELVRVLKHAFHLKCLADWFLRDDSTLELRCPLCRMRKLKRICYNGENSLVDTAGMSQGHGWDYTATRRGRSLVDMLYMSEAETTRQSFLDAEILIRTESGGYRISISELELLFAAHAVVMEGPLPGEYCPKVYRGATCKSKRVCTCGTFLQRAECPHVCFVAGLQGEMDLGHFPEKRKPGRPSRIFQEESVCASSHKMDCMINTQNAGSGWVKSVPGRPLRQSLPSRQEQLRLVASPVKASALIAEATTVLQSRSSGHNSAPTPRPRDPTGPGIAERWSSRSRSQGPRQPGTRQLARIEGVVTEIQRELNEVKVLSDSFEEPGTQSTLLAPTLAHVGVGELMHVAGGISPVGSRTKVLGSHVSGHGATLLHPLQPAGSVSPAYLYPAGTPRQTHSWHRELEERKWRANAEHILMIESSWAQRVKEAEEAASRSDERARVAEEAHGRLLREKAEMADAAQARARQLADEQEKYTSLEARETSLQATLSALEERAASADKLAAEHRAEQAAVADELDMVSGRFEEQLQHSMELKKELSRMRDELDARKTDEQTKHRDIEREWKQRVEELKTGLTTARDTIQAQKIQMAKLKASEKSDTNSDLHEAIAHWKTQLSQANTKLEDQHRLTAHLQQKLASLEDELAAAHAAHQSIMIDQSSQSEEAVETYADMVEVREQLRGELREREVAILAATRQMEMCESLNNELDQAVADLQTDLTACKQKEEAHQATVESRDAAVEEWKAQAQQWQVRASQLEEELDAQVKALQDSVCQVTDSTTQIAKLESQLSSFKQTDESSQVVITSLQQEVSELQAIKKREAAALQQELAVAKKDGERLQEEQLALQQAVEHQTGLEADAHAEAAGFKDALEAAAEKNMLLESTTQLMQQELDTLENETASAKGKAGEDQQYIAKLQQQLEVLEDEIVSSKKLQEAQLGSHADLHRALLQTEDQLARSLLNDEMQQELTAKLRSSLNSSEVNLSEYRSNLEAQEAMESQLRKHVENFRSESKEQKKIATDLRLQLAESEDERNASDTAYQTLQSIETELRGKLSEEGEQLSELHAAFQVQQSVNAQLEQSLATSVSELSQARADASMQDGLARQLEDKLEASEACKVHTEDKLQRHADRVSELQEQVTLLEGSLATALSASELQAAATTELQQSCDHLQEQMQGLQSELRAKTEVAEQQLNSEIELKDLAERQQAEILELRLRGEAKESLEAALKEKKMQEVEMKHSAAIAEAEIAGARNSAKAQQKLVGELRNCLRDTEAESAKALAKFKEQQDRQEQRQKEAEDRLAAAQTELVSAGQRVEDLEQLALEQKTRFSSLEGDLAKARCQEKVLQEAAEDLRSDISKREGALLQSLASSEVHQASEAALRKALHTQEKILADERVEHDATLRQLAERAAQVEELQQNLAELQAGQKKLELRLRQTQTSTDAKLRDAASIEASLREKLQDVWSKLATKADSGLNPEGLSDPHLYSVFEQKASKIHRKVAAAMRRAGDAHHAALELEISKASQLQLSGEGEARSLFLRSAASGRDQRDRLAQELQEMLAQVQSTLLLKCAEGTDAGSDEEELAAERLELDAQLISQELPLLTSSPLQGIPQLVLKAMAGLCGVEEPGDKDLDLDGRFPVHWAARQGRRDVIEFLLRYISVDDGLNQRDPDGRTPLFYAERAGNDSLALFLRENGSDANPQEPVRRRPATSAIPDAFTDVIKVVEERGWHAVNWMEGFTMLHWAAEKGHSDFCRYFVDLNADLNAVDSRGRTALQCAVDSKNAEAELVLRELMGLPQRTDEPGAPCEEPPEMPELVSAAASNQQHLGIPAAYVRVMQQIDLIGWDKMQWARGFTLLHWAAKHDRADLCELFLWHGADPEHRDASGHSALDYARLRQPEASAVVDALLRGRPSMKPTVG